MGTPFKLRNGLLLLSTEAPGGVYNSTQLKKIAALCDGDSAVIKATEDQRLALFVAPDKAAKVAAELKAVGLGVRHYQDGLHQPVNCLGELCGEHLQDAMGTSMDVARELAGVTLGTPLKIGINGCARCCVATHTLDISVIGDTSGYRMSLGGKNSQLPEMASFMAEGVPAAKLPKLIAKVVAVYRELAQKDETLQEVMERAGSKRFIDALAPYSQDAHQGDDPFAGIGGDDAAPAAGSSDDELKLDDLPSSEDFDDAPEIGDDLGAAAPEPGFDGDIDPAGGGLEGDLDGEVPIGGEPEELSGLDDELTMESGTDELAMDEVGGGELGMDPGTDELALDETGGELGMDEAGGGDLGMDEAGGELSMEGTDDLAMDATGDLQMEDVGAGELSMDDVGGGELSMDAGTDELAMDGELGMDEPGGGELAMESEELVLDDTFALAEGLELEEPAPLAKPLTLAKPLAAVAKAEPPAPAPKPAAIAAAPAPKPEAAASDLEDEMTADEVNEDEADAFEAKLNESIAEEESFPEIEDHNSADRHAAMQLIEASAEAPGSDEGDDSLDAPIDFDNLQIDHDHVEVPEDVHDDDEIVGHEATLASMPGKAPAAPAAAARGGFEFTGIDVTGEGRIALLFAGGANIAIDPRTLVPGVRREMTMGGKKITIVPDQNGLSVEVDGVAIFLPRRGAA